LIKYLKQLCEKGNSVLYQNFGTIGYHFNVENKRCFFINLDPYFLKTNKLEFQSALGWLNKPFEPTLILNLNISDISLISDIEKTTVASCLQEIVNTIGIIISENPFVEIDLEELGKLYSERGQISFKSQVKQVNINQNKGKMTVKRIMDMKNLNTNMNF